MSSGSPAVTDFAMRVVRRRRGWLRKAVLTEETATLDDRDTIAGWIRGMHEAKSQMVTVQRPWGSIFVHTSGRPAAGVLASVGTRQRYVGHALGMPMPDGGDALTPAEVERIVLDVLTADSLPEWPGWHEMENPHR